MCEKTRTHGSAGGGQTYPNLLGTGYRVTKESMVSPGYGIAEILNFKVGYNHDTKFQLYTTSHEQGKVTNSTDPGFLKQPSQDWFFRYKSAVGDSVLRNRRPRALSEEGRTVFATTNPSETPLR